MNILDIDVDKAKALRAAGETYATISEIMGCSPSWCASHLKGIPKAGRMKNFPIESKDVVGFEGIYAVTPCGKVYSYRNDRYLANHNTTHGYPRVVLCADKYETHYIHRLVARAYIPNPENKPTVNHINGNKTDNRVCNLEWATQQEQVEHAISIGLMKTDGEQNPCAVLTEQQAKEIWFKYHNTKCSHQSLALEYGISHTTVGKLVRGDTWNTVGTVKETKKRRKDRGETHSQAVLTWEKVDEMRAKYASGGYTLRSLAAEYGIHNGHLWAIIHKKMWKDEDRPLQFAQRMSY